MATLVAIGYPDQSTAEQARNMVQGLETELIIQADQVAAISCDLEGRYHVQTTHGGASAGGGAAWGGFWGYGGTVIRTSLSDEDTKRLQEALTPPSEAGSA